MYTWGNYVACNYVSNSVYNLCSAYYFYKGVVILFLNFYLVLLNFGTSFDNLIKSDT